MGHSTNMLMIAGTLLALLGIAGLAFPTLTTEQAGNVVRVGNLRIEMQENNTLVIPTLFSGGALVFGIVLISGGFCRKQ